jgi:hypothetical protein
MSMNYGTLKTTVAGNLHRTDLSVVILDFIDQARLRIGGDLRSRANYATGSVTSFSAGLSAVPTNVGKLVSVSQDNVPLRWVPPEQIDLYPNGGVWSEIGADLKVPGAGATTVVVITFFAIPLPLVNNADVSVPMLQYPQLWIYAATAEGAMYIQDFEQAASMNAAYEEVIRNANRSGDEVRFGAAPAMQTDQPFNQGMAQL